MRVIRQLGGMRAVSLRSRRLSQHEMYELLCGSSTCVGPRCMRQIV